MTRISDERYAEAESLLEAGVSFKDAADAISTSPVNLYRKFPQFTRTKKSKPDPVPGGGDGKARTSAAPRPSGRKRSKGYTSEQMLAFYSKAATLPALPMQLWVGCDFCAAHFANNGPQAAERLLALSEHNPTLRAILETIYEQWEKAAWGALLITWLGVPLAHHMLPERMYWTGQMFLGLPDREAPNEGVHVHTNGNGATSDDLPTPFGSMDTETILAMARNMGLDVSDIDVSDLLAEDDDEDADTATEPEPTDEPDEPEPDDTPEPESSDAASAPDEADSGSVV